MTQEPGSIPAYTSFPITLFSEFELSVGLIDLPVDQTIFTPPIVNVLHAAFSVVSYILLLNLLIAMMSDTHWRVAQERNELWRTQVTYVDLIKQYMLGDKLKCMKIHSTCLILRYMMMLLEVVATTLMLERRLPRCLWPRLGVCGLNYGLMERWYLRWESDARNQNCVFKWNQKNIWK